jgi:hypothetical protein
MIGNSSLDSLHRLAKPMPMTGRLGVVTLWSVWLTAPVAILNAYTQWGGVWIPFVYVSLGAAIYVAKTTNTRAGGRVPSVVASRVARFAPLIVLATVATGYAISLTASMPFATVIAGLVTFGFAAGITTTIAATPPRELDAN